MMPRSVFTSTSGSSASPISGRSGTSLVAGSTSFSCNALSIRLAASGNDRRAARLQGPGCAPPRIKQTQGVLANLANRGRDAVKATEQRVYGLLTDNG